jgi:hypothetical protein
MTRGYREQTSAFLAATSAFVVLRDRFPGILMAVLFAAGRNIAGGAKALRRREG